MQARPGTMDSQPGSVPDSSRPKEGQTQTHLRSGKSVQHDCGDMRVGVTAVVNG